VPNGPTELTPLRAARLELRSVRLTDAAFFVTLLNEPTWIENIGDRGVRTQAQAESYIRERIWSQYATHGFGLYVVQAAATAQPLGLCGLVRREFLPGPDLGVALLPEWVGHGYAGEAAGAVIAHAQAMLAIEPLYAITRPGNHRSIRMLGRLGFHREGPIPVPPEGTEAELYVRP